MKEFTDYLDIRKYPEKKASSYKHCGIYFKAKYIDKIDMKEEPSASMKEGIYFEYLCTGGLPRNGQIPEPEKTLKGTLTTAYQRATEASKFFQRIIEHYNIEILKVGYSLSTDLMTGILDIWAKWNGKECIIDLKYSGLIDDKWNELGWHDESLELKNSLMIQGVHYKILINETLGFYDVPFYYFVFNSKDSSDMKIIEQVVDEDRFDKHKKIVIDTKDRIEFLVHNNGFVAHPNYRHCKDCPLYDNCEHKHTYPEVTKVYY
jgi:hypothetical protein